MFRAYYEKKMDEGLHYMNVIGHVSRKMTAVVFAVLRTGNPTSPFYQTPDNQLYHFGLPSLGLSFLRPFSDIPHSLKMKFYPLTNP